MIIASAASVWAVEPLFAKSKNQNQPEGVSFGLISTSGKAYPISNEKTTSTRVSYRVTLTLSCEWTKNKQNKNSMKLKVTDGSLTIDGGYYAAEVYKIIDGAGTSNGKVQIVYKVQEVTSGSTCNLILHGTMNSDGFCLKASESKLASHYFQEITGQLQK